MLYKNKKKGVSIYAVQCILLHYWKIDNNLPSLVLRWVVAINGMAYRLYTYAIIQIQDKKKQEEEEEEAQEIEHIERRLHI